MGWTQRMAWGVFGAAATMLTRRVANVVMHDAHGKPVLANVTQRNRSFALMMTLAMSAGVVLALSDVLRENRQQVTQPA